MHIASNSAQPAIVKDLGCTVCHGLQPQHQLVVVFWGHDALTLRNEDITLHVKFYLRANLGDGSSRQWIYYDQITSVNQLPVREVAPQKLSIR